MRSGKEAYASAHAIVDAMRQGLKACGLPVEFVNILDDITRESASELMRARGDVDLLIPRGGAGLIRSCVENALVPCIETGTGICHIYVDKSADEDMALSIVRNAEMDFDTEFLDYILAIAIVDDVSSAVEHIARHSTGHSEAVIAQDVSVQKTFLSEVDSAAVYVNASTRFTDGGEFGLGCEMGISTQKLHARGPMGLCELTSYQYRITGNGQIR